MRSESELAQLTDKVQAQVDAQISRGLSDHPTTPLEQHAFELGRLSVLKWLEPAVQTECSGLAENAGQ